MAGHKLDTHMVASHKNEKLRALDRQNDWNDIKTANSEKAVLQTDKTDIYVHEESIETKSAVWLKVMAQHICTDKMTFVIIKVHPSPTH
jgi:hypothetical protein